MLLFYLTLVDGEEDKSKLRFVYENYSKRMYSMAYSVLRNREDAEDAVHETFISIARNIKSIDNPESQKTLSYVLKAVKNTSLNYIRKNDGEPQYLPLDDVKVVSDVDFLEMIEIKNDYAKVVEAITELDEKYSDVMYMHFVEGMQVSQICDVLKRKKSTVKQQLVRGKKILLQNLKDIRE